MNNQFSFIVPDNTPLDVLLDALVFFGRPVIESKEVNGGYQVSVMADAQSMASYRAYAHKMGLDGVVAKPVLAENKPAKETVKGTPAGAAKQPAPAEPKPSGIFQQYNLDELMGRAVRVITEFMAAHTDQLTPADYEAMLNRELAGKKRSSVVSALQALLQ